MANEKIEQGDEAAEASEADGVAQLESALTSLGERALELDETTLAEASDDERAELEAEAEGEVAFESTTARRSVRLSPHFVLAEFHCHDGTPVPAQALPALRRLVRQVLEPMREKFGQCRVNSGFRTDSYNRKIGGEDKSQHLYHRSPADVAADVAFASGSPREWAAEAARLLRDGGGIGTYGTFAHVDNRPSRARWSG